MPKQKGNRIMQLTDKKTILVRFALRYLISNADDENVIEFVQTLYNINNVNEFDIVCKLIDRVHFKLQ